MSRSPAVALLALLIVPACGEVPTAPVDPLVTPSENFINGPGDLANVDRFLTNNADFLIRDLERGLALAVGKEAFPGSGICDFLPTDIMAVQEVRFGESVSHAMGRAEDLNLSLFRVIDPPCGAVLIAKGTGAGRFVSHASDKPGASATFTASATGLLAGLDDGEHWHVQGIIAFVGGERRVSEVRLRPARGREAKP